MIFMKKEHLFLALLALSIAACEEVKEPLLLNQLVPAFTAHFDNFQQCWQENTAEEKHRTNSAEKHLHLHSTFKKVDLDSKDALALLQSIYQGRDSSHLLAQNLF